MIRQMRTAVYCVVCVCQARAELCTTLRTAFVDTGSVLANVPPLLALMAEYTMKARACPSLILILCYACKYIFVIA